MKRIYLILSISLLFSFGAKSQFQIGIKGGINSTNISVKSLISDEQNPENNFFKQEKLGYQFGIFSRINLLGLYVEPNLLYYKSKFILNPMSIGLGVESHYDLSEINIPIFVGLQLNPIRIFAGPVIYLEEHKISSLISETKMQFKESNYGIQTGVGLDIKKIKLEMVYENISHSRILENTEVSALEGTELSKSSRISLLFGYKF